MLRKRARTREKIDWENIPINIVPVREPNPHNPYSALAPEARLEQLQELYQKIYARKISKLSDDEIK